MAEQDSSSRQAEILAMFAEVPIEKVREKMMELLEATRTVSMGRDRAPVAEPDNAIRLKVWQTIVEQQAGSAPNRKPVEPKADKKAEADAGGIKRQSGRGKE